VKNRRRPSQLVAGFHQTTDIASIGRFTRMCSDCEEPATTANFVAESSQVVAGSTHSWKLNSSVEFSFPFFLGLWTHCVKTFTGFQLFPLYCGFCVVDGRNLIQKSQVSIYINQSSGLRLHESILFLLGMN